MQTSLRSRLALLLGALVVAFLGCMQLLRVLEGRQAARLQRESLAANELLLEKWIDLANQPLRRFVQDFSQWEQLAEFTSRPDLAWADRNLRPNLGNYEAHALWVLDAAGNPLYSAQANPGPPLPLPVSGAPADGSVFAESRDGLLEIWRAPVGAPGGPRRGTLVLARLWGPGFLDALGRLNESELLLAPADPGPAPADGREILLPLAGADGRPVRHLLARLPAAPPATALAQDVATGYLFLGFTILVLLALGLAVRQWVLRPLARISESLQRNDPAPIQPLLHDRTELGRVAQLVESSFRQTAALNLEVQERRRTEEALRDSEVQLRQALELRARLARDLHDGVIQSIYASGLGLEGAMAQMERDPAGARQRLQLCRQSLNDVIRDVRGFISGIEPEALHHQGFAQELASLVRTMQALWPVQIEVQLDPAVESRLSPSQQLHALQICRECISNAVRHGATREIDVRLGSQDGVASLAVRDKGRGFDPGLVRGKGRGLVNLATRARDLGGEISIESRPGAGASIRITFPVSPA